MDKIYKDNSSSSGVTFVECYVRRLLFADDLGLLNSNKSDFQCPLNRFSDACLDAGMKISMAKTKILHSSGNYVEGFGGDFKPRHVYTFSVSPDLEVEAQSH